MHLRVVRDIHDRQAMGRSMGLLERMDGVGRPRAAEDAMAQGVELR